ncbi:Cytochrome c553 [Azospirillum oryzae]|uniref:Cytochrome c553 n=1 Tax=Azospirillum oryzae TaxID=286727 RepID=A0A1X7HLC7_9PROT|nr:c-type cytochrome [Azospirillum oryzae]SMF88854.1 Cytochrome c553 [Azospirillum oryzae]
MFATVAAKQESCARGRAKPYRLSAIVALLSLTAPPLHADQLTEIGHQIFEHGSGGDASAAGCSSCHGSHGEGNQFGGIPKLAGFDSFYITRQLHGFKSGIRTNPIMSPYASALDDHQISAVAAYIATLPDVRADSRAVSQDERVSGGQAKADAAPPLVRDGDPTRGIPACATCHGAVGDGYATAPALAGQSADYLARTLLAWRNGKRPEGPDYFMSLISPRLTRGEIEALSAYYADLARPVQHSSGQQP